MFRPRKDRQRGDATPSAAVAEAPGPVAGAVGPQVFLGGLSSEIDEPDHLAEPFETIALVTERVVTAYRRRCLTPHEAGERLAVLRLRTDDDVEWTLGATSQRWYRRVPGGDFKLAVPTGLDDATLRATASAAVKAVTEMPRPADPEAAVHSGTSSELA
jgi:hypothetical protein